MAASLDVLRKSLAANGLPTTGNKADMLARLLQGTPDKRKSPGKKAVAHVAAAASLAAAAPTSDDAEFVEFAAAERSNLTASGITSEDAMNEEIMRRWTVLQSVKPTPTKKADAETVTLPVVLDTTQMTQAKLAYVSVVEGGHMYVRVPDAAPTESKPARKSGGKEAAGAKTLSKPVAVKAESKPELKETASSSALGKRKAEDLPADDEKEMQDMQDMSFACDVATMRLVNKVSKDNMVAVLKDFGVPTKGSKEELAALLAEQLHYETDDEDGA